MQLSRILFRNLGTKLLALAIACATWFVLSGQRRERISERSYRIPLSVVNVPAGTMIVSPLPDAVDVRLRGAFTPLRTLEPGKLEAVVDLADAVARREALRPRARRHQRAAGGRGHRDRAGRDPPRPRHRRREDAPDRRRDHRRAGARRAPRRGGRRAEERPYRRPGQDAGAASTTVPTEPVSVEGRDATFSETTTLALPAPGVRVREGQLVTVRVRIRPAPRSEPTPRPDAGRGRERKDVKLFGTDGLRGKAGDFPLDPASVRLLGRELGKRLSGGRPARVVVGGDTRESTPRIVADLAAGLAEGGCNVASAGVITTPGVAELVLELGAAAGVAVSASHNPYEDNGIKIFGPDGRKWPDEEEEFLEKQAARRRRPQARRAADAGARPTRIPGLVATYVSRLKASVPESLDGFPVLIDVGNGAAFQIGPRAFQRAGARVTAIHDAPDGRNINLALRRAPPRGDGARDARVGCGARRRLRRRRRPLDLRRRDRADPRRRRRALDHRPRLEGAAAG